MGNLLKAELFKLRKSFHYKLLLLFPFGIGLIFGGLIYYYNGEFYSFAGVLCKEQNCDDWFGTVQCVSVKFAAY